MKKLLLSSVALLGMFSVASAADLPRRVVAPAPMVAAVPVFTWTGIYAGISGGYLWSDAEASFVGGTGVAGLAAAGGLPDFSLESDGFIVGGTVGGNLQLGMFVIGLEADISYTDVEADNSITTTVAPLATMTATSNLDYLGTVRGRLGLAFDRFMVYGTGGLAFGGHDLNASIVSTTVPAGFTTLTGGHDDTAYGWTAGVGGEWAFTNNLTFKIEYLHYDLEDETVAVTNAGATANYRFRNEGDIVRGGINVKF